MPVICSTNTSTVSWQIVKSLWFRDLTNYSPFFKHFIHHKLTNHINPIQYNDLAIIVKNQRSMAYQNNRILLLSSSFGFSHQGLPQRSFHLQLLLSCVSSSVTSTSATSSFTTLLNLLFGLPRFLFPGNSNNIKSIFKIWVVNRLMIPLWHYGGWVIKRLGFQVTKSY